MSLRFSHCGLKTCSWLAVLLCFASALRGQEATQWPAKDVPELQVLNCYVGAWEVVMASGDKPETPTFKGKSTTKWVLNGRFLEQTGSLQQVDGDKSIKVTTFMTYDVEKKAYRSWTFTSEGFAAENDGKWDAATQTMTSVSRPRSNGQTVTTTAVFSEAGIEKWKITIADQTGKIVNQLVGKNTRQRE